MSKRDPYLYTLGPRVRAYEPTLKRFVMVRKTDDERVPGIDRQSGKPIYSDHCSTGELGPFHWYRTSPANAEIRPTWPGTWTVSTRALCGAFSYETEAVMDDFGALVLPEAVREEAWLAEYRRARRGQA